MLTLAAMAERTSLYKSTILRLAGSLERFGYLVRDLGVSTISGRACGGSDRFTGVASILVGTFVPSCAGLSKLPPRLLHFMFARGRSASASTVSIRRGPSDTISMKVSGCLLTEAPLGACFSPMTAFAGSLTKGFARTVITPRWASATPRLLPWRCLYSTRRRSCAGHCHHQRHSVGLMLRRIAALSRRCAKALTGLRLLSRAIDTANLDISQCLTR